MFAYDVASLAILAANDAALRLYGYSRTAFLNLTVQALSPQTPGTKSRGDNASHRRFTQRNGVRPQLKRNGRVFPAQIMTFAFRDAGRRARLVQATDVTNQTPTEPAQSERGAPYSSIITAMAEGGFSQPAGRKRTAVGTTTSQDRERHLAQLEAVLDHLTEGLVIADPAGKMLHWNPAALKIHGLADGAEWQGELSDFVRTFELATPDGEILPLDRWPLARILRGEDVHGCELQVRRKDRADWRRFLSYGGALARGKDGHPLLAVVTITDITRRKQADEALRRNTERLRQGVRVAQVGLFEHNHITNEIYYSAVMREIWGWDPKASISLAQTIDSVAPEDRSRFIAAIQRAHDPAGDGLFSSEHRIVRPDGSIRWVSTRAQTTFEGKAAARHAVRTIGALIDITESKEAEVKLAASERRFRALTEKAAEDIILLDAAGRITYESPHMTPLLGFAPGEMTGRHGFDLVHPDDQPRAREMFARVLRHAGASTSGELRMRRKDGGWSWIRLYATNLLHEPAVDAVVLNLHDITERKQAEGALRSVLRNARTIIMRAEVTAPPGWDQNPPDWSAPHFRWTSHFDDEPACQEVLPLKLEPGEDYAVGWARAMHPDDWTPMSLAAARAFTSGASHWSQEFRAIDQHGRLHWFTQAASVEGISPGRWRVTTNNTDITERKQAEDALRQSEQALRLVIDTVPHGIFAKDADGRFVLANRAIAQFAGLTPEQMEGHTDSELFGIAAQTEAFRRDDLEVIRSGTPRFIPEEPLTDATGLTRILQTTKVPFTVPQTGQPAILGVAVDITARKEAENALRYHYNLIQSITNSTAAAIFVTDEEGRISYMNPEAVRTFGFAQTELIGQVLHDRLHHHHADGRSFAIEDCALAKIFTSGRTMRNHEDVFFRKDGTPVQVSCSNSRLEVDGKAVGTVIVLHDVTARKEAEENLQRARDELEQRVTERTAELARMNQQLMSENAERLQAEQAIRRQSELLDMASDAIIIRDFDGTIRYWNRGAERLYGFSFAEAKGKPSNQLLSTVFPKGLGHFQSTLAKEGVWTGEITQTTKLGRRVVVESHHQLVKQPGGSVLVLVTNHDITERVSLHDEIVAAGERERERIGQNLHDGLCQLLTAARLKADSLVTRLAEHEPANVRTVKSVATLIAQAVDEARDLARGLEPVEHLPEGLMSALQQLATNTARLFNVNCTTDCLQPVHVEDHRVATELFRIAQEAVNNAIKHSRAGTIRIRLAPEAGAGVLTITCDGSPFPKHPRTSGMGLKTMHFRAGRIGASLEIKRGPRRGTIVRCALPGPTKSSPNSASDNNTSPQGTAP